MGEFFPRMAEEDWLPFVSGRHHIDVCLVAQHHPNSQIYVTLCEQRLFLSVFTNTEFQFPAAVASSADAP